MKKFYLSILSLLFLYSLKTNAQVVYTDIDPDATTTVSGPGSLPSLVSIDFNGDGTEEYNFRWDDFGGGTWFLHMTYASSSTNLMAVLGATSNGPLILPLINNAPIGVSLTYTNSLPEPFIGNVEDGNFQGLGDRYIGCKFNIGANTHYGWVRVNLDNSLNFIVKDYAYESTPNTAIDAGDNGATASVKDFEFNNYFSCFPVPAKNILTIENKKSLQINQISVIDINGQIVISKTQIVSDKIIIDISQLKTGIYFLKLETKKNILSKKIIVE